MIKRYLRLNNFQVAIIAFALFILLIAGYFMARQSSLKAVLIKQKAELSALEQTNIIVPGDLAVTAGYNSPGTADLFVQAMNDLDKNTPEYVFLKDISYDKISAVLVIRGGYSRKEKNPGVSVFVKNLSTSKIFDGIELSYVNESQIMDIPIFDFEIKCKLIGAGR